MVCGKCNQIFSNISEHTCNSEYVVYIDLGGKESIDPFKPKPRDMWTLETPRPITFSATFGATGKLI